ncbi:MAG: hypothetical protein K2K84_06630 [Muribaculaceae bacterium]|nr:hypothetical protein [Muribaculaceae bacterium]
MKIQFITLPMIAVMVSSCIDDNYDLSDIDTTSRLQVVDLTLPVNMDDVLLGDIITFDENSKIQPIEIFGKKVYALTQEGDFNSQPIFIKTVSAAAPVLSPVTKTLSLSNVPSSAKKAKAPELSFTFDITEMGNTFEYADRALDSSIDALYSAKVEPMTFAVTLEAVSQNVAAEKIGFTNLVIAMPKGMTATPATGSYDAKTGLWTIPSDWATGNSFNTSMTVTAIDFAANGAVVKDGAISLKSEVTLKSGQLTVVPDLNVNHNVDFSSGLEFRASFQLSPLTVKAISGRISYKLEGMDIAPVSLANIPDFLSGDGTNINLANPQLFLSVTNPVGADGLDCRTGLTLSAIRDDSPTLDFSLDNGYFTIGHGDGKGSYDFVMAPSDKDIIFQSDGGPQPTFVPFTGLGEVLSSPAGAAVKGLPKSIGIHLDEPQIPLQEVTDFELGRSIDGVKGRYELVAPLALKDGSTIVYSDRKDGWNDEDVDAITITRLTLNCTVTNTCPVSAELHAYPIDKEGNRIPGVELKTVSPIAANSVDQPVSIELSGTIKHLDGVIYEAVVNAGSSEEALSPNQTIALKNIRATVSGYYEKEL